MTKCAAWRKPSATRRTKRDDLAQKIRVALLPGTPWTTTTSCWKLRRHRRRRGLAVRRRLVPHGERFASLQLEGRGNSASEGTVEGREIIAGVQGRARSQS
jgi:hypothetical protein